METVQRWPDTFFSAEESHPIPSNPTQSCSINAPQTPKQAAPNCTAPAGFPIQVDEAERTVTGGWADGWAGESAWQVAHAPWLNFDRPMRRKLCHWLPCSARPCSPVATAHKLLPTHPHPAVSAGVPQRMLLDYLAAYNHCKQPAGWTLPAFTWWTDQTIGGAVATNSHGSTLKYGSLSSQVGYIGGRSGGWEGWVGTGQPAFRSCDRSRLQP